jgi:hypothetical protein
MSSMRAVKTDTQGRVQVFPIKASTLTRGGVGNLTATFTATRPHRLTTGQRVKVIGADKVEFNGQFSVTVTGATTFTYPMTELPSGNAVVTDVIAQRLLEAEEYAPFVGVNRNSAAMRTDDGADEYYASAAAEKDKIVLTAPGKVFSALLKNLSGGNRYLCVFDSVTAAADGQLPILPAYLVPAGQVGGYDFSTGVPFKAGIYVACSSTDGTKTLVVADDAQFFVSYRDVL